MFQAEKEPKERPEVREVTGDQEKREGHQSHCYSRNMEDDSETCSLDVITGGDLIARCFHVVRAVHV